MTPEYVKKTILCTLKNVTTWQIYTNIHIISKYLFSYGDYNYCGHNLCIL